MNRTVITLLVGGMAAMALRKRLQPPCELTGQTVLITGGSRGLGFILAREFAREGCNIVICARNQVELDEAQNDLERLGAAVLAIRCDVSDQEAVASMVHEATRRFGRIDILVNNAGVIQVGRLQTVRVQDFEDALAVMFWGMLYPTLAVLPQMRARHSGRIVNITSIGGKVAVPHLLPYGSAKFAAVGLSEGLRAELLHQGITVTTIVPGLMRTGSYLNALFKGKKAEEFTWFALGASLPVISMDAERAARQIIEATKRGEAERILSLPANILARFQGLFPGFTTNVVGTVAALLLPAGDSDDPAMVRGEVAQRKLPPSQRKLLEALTTLGRQAARRFQS
jgi:short-subunit dehydrogenase